MSRILKRPMFRRGGKVNEGIMSGIVDRTKHAENPFPGSNIDRKAIEGNTALLESILREYTPKTRLPIGEFGLDIATGTPILDALKTRYGQFTKKDDAREAAIKGGAAKLAIGQALKSDKVGTLKQGRNTSDQTLFGVEPGKTGFFSPKQLVAAQGLIQPIDNRLAFSFDTKSGTLTQMPVNEQERINKNKADSVTIVASVETVGKLKNSMIERVKNAPTGAVGGVFGALEGISDQMSQVSESLGFNKDSLDFDVNTSEKLDKYLTDKGVTRGATEFAKLKSSVINLAYNLAKIKEPGNPRLSEGDIIRQLDRIKFGQSRDVFIGALNQIYDDEVIGARGQIKGYGLDPDDYFGTGEKTPSTQKGGKGGKGADTNNDPFNIR